jgi:DNA-binding NtrC family response regulator
MLPRTQSKLVALDSNRTTLMEVVKIARSWYEVLSTTDPLQAKVWLKEQTDIAVFVTDHATQQCDGKSILEYARAEFSDIRRVVLTSYSDLSLLIQGLHNGAIQKLVQKPIDRNELMAAIVPFAAQAGGGGMMMLTRPIYKAG